MGPVIMPTAKRLASFDDSCARSVPVALRIHADSMLHRATVLEEIVRILPPEVAERVNKVVDSQHDQHAGIEQVLSRGARRTKPG